MSESCIYAGTVHHTRFEPFRHNFDYRLFMMYLDLDELPELFDPYWGWSARRPAIARFRRDHHLGDPSTPLKASVSELVRKETGQAVSGPIRLLTHLQYLGYCFNPVSFYFCCDASGSITTLVAEVNNTPWGERHCHVFPCEPLSEQPQVFCHAKSFHVSPFMSMNLDYKWTFALTTDRLDVSVHTTAADSPMLSAVMSLKRREISGRNLTATLLQYPWMTVRVTTAIYYQALRLWLRGAPVFVHPAKLRR